MILLPHFTKSLLARSLLLWFVLRAFAVSGAASPVQTLRVPPAQPLLLHPQSALLLIAIVAAAGWIYARRRNEDRFLLALGYSRTNLLATLALPLVLLELVLGIVARLE